MAAFRSIQRAFACASVLLFHVTGISAVETDSVYIEGPVERLDYHVRVSAPTKASEISVGWGNHKAIISLPEKFYDEYGIPAEARYDIFRRDNDRLLLSGRIAVNYGTGKNAGFSAIIRSRPSGAVIEMGGAEENVSVVIPFDAKNPGYFSHDIPKHLTLLRSDLLYTPSHKAECCQFPSVDSLLTYLRTSKDPKEGVWKYLDRKTNPEKCRHGGRYTLASIKAGKGYELVYLDGDDSGEWEPLRVKARLEPSGFVDNYDMQWFLANGNMYDDDTNASFTTEGHILECRFPEVEGTLRFRRLDEYRQSLR